MPLQNLIPTPLTPAADRITSMQAAATWAMEPYPAKASLLPTVRR